MSLAIETIMETDTSAWPSSYGRGKRVDLEKFFEKVQQEQQEQQKMGQYQQHQQQQQPSDENVVLKSQCESGTLRQVRFSPDPPTVFVYEAEYDTFDRLVSSIEQSKDTWPSYARRPPSQLDLRPIRNHQYRTPPPPCINTTFTKATTNTFVSPTATQQQQVQPLRRTSSLSAKSLLSTGSSSPSTPPLSPSPLPPCLSSGDESSDEEDQQSYPHVPLTPTNSLPFSPTTLTKRITSVFSRMKRS
ncbi:hypothetical protein [Absidia glauca]|uniref:Uncharacterized protein n=1 Tax=Absidia glauca TaxID=4829 RepID=A0A168NS08_ABSGL|nr:hypothetical protein [Absidia glauca]